MSAIRTVLSAAAAVLLLAGQASAADLRIAIVQAQAGEARKYQPLLEYLRTKGVGASFVTTADYRAAADLFAKGGVDAMFGGSGIAGTFIIKDLAYPVVHGVGTDGVGTYSAVVVAPKGSPRFTGAGGYFDGKRVIYSALASAGEFYFESLGKSAPAAKLKAASHGAALDALSRGQADVAIVKNHVWSKEQGKYPGLEKVGGDDGENPDGTLVVAKHVAQPQVAAISAALLGLEADGSPAAKAAKDALKLRGYEAITVKGFAHTLDLLKRARVGKDFTFAY